MGKRNQIIFSALYGLGHTKCSSRSHSTNKSGLKSASKRPISGKMALGVAKDE